MANDYIINWSNGVLKTPFTLTGNSQDTSTTSLTLTGKGSSNWGEPLQENQLKLLEHFASDVAPANPTIGQLWYDSGTTTLWICEATNPSTVWRRIYSVSGISRTTAPASPGNGQLWYDTTTNILKHWNGSEWIPMYSSTSLTSEGAPSSPKVGQLWYRASLNTLHVWNGTAWVVIFTGNSISAATAPSTPVRGQLWFDTVNNILKIYDNTNAFVPIAGGSFAITGDLNMNSFKVVNLANGTATTDAVNKSQLDGAITSVNNSITTLTNGLAERKVLKSYQVPASYVGTGGNTWGAPVFAGSGSATTWPAGFFTYASISTVYGSANPVTVVGPADGSPYRVQFQVHSWAAIGSTAFRYNVATKILVNGNCSGSGLWSAVGDVGVMGSGGDMGAGVVPNNWSHTACRHIFTVASTGQTFTGTNTFEVRTYAVSVQAGLSSISYVVGNDFSIITYID